MWSTLCHYVTGSTKGIEMKSVCETKRYEKKGHALSLPDRSGVQVCFRCGIVLDRHGKEIINEITLDKSIKV